MDTAVGYRDAVLAEMKGQDMDEDDGGFPGIGQAADDINEAGGWEQCFCLEMLILLGFFMILDLTWI
jgi:hypothetical protein